MSSPEGVSVSYDALRALERLDGGAFATELDRFASVAADGNDPATVLWRAELLVYLDRLGEASEAVESVAPVLGPRLTETSDLGACARRRHLIAAEIAYFEGRYDEADAGANAVSFAAERARDEQSAVRATFDSGRILRRRGEFASSL